MIFSVVERARSTKRWRRQRYVSYSRKGDNVKPTSKRSIANITNYRHKKILEMLYQRQSISADELATEFGVSKITIRRDLDALAGDKFLERTRGGAVSIAGLRLEEFFDAKDHVAKREKTLIGR